MRSSRSRRSALDRRAFMSAALVTAAAGVAAAQAPSAPSRAKGPIVWLDLDQQALDEAYDQNVWAPNRELLLARFASNSELVRRRVGAPRRFTYGPTPIEGLDVYPTTRPNAPMLVFVHGGQWRGGLAKDYAFFAEPFVRAGAHVAVLDFVNVTETGGDLRPMADQVRRGIAWIHRNAASFGGDAARLFVAAHSSGAHLAGVALVTDWRGQFDVPADVIKGAVLCSGMYDLKPVRLSARSRYVTFTDAIEDALSAQRHLERLSAPVVVGYGTLESPEFQRQSRDFAAAVKAAGKPVQLVAGEHYNHFELLETLGNPYGLMGRAALELMHLA